MAAPNGPRHAGGRGDTGPLGLFVRSHGRHSDDTLILADVAHKAISQVHDTIYSLLRSNQMDEKAAKRLAVGLSEGRWTHDYPISADEARELGLPVTEEMPVEIYALMDLYPQAAQRRPSVEYVPTPHRSPAGSPGGRDSVI